MDLRRIIIPGRRSLRSNRPAQIVLLFAFWLLGEALARWTGLPIPGGIIGMSVVLALLASGWLGQGSLRRGANWFIAELLLFFIPAVLAILDHPEFLGILGLKIVAVILGGTVVVMGVTAVVVDLCCRAMGRLEADGHVIE